MLSLNLSAKSSFTLTNEHKVFEGTEFADTVFSLIMRPITALKFTEVRRRNMANVRGLPISDDIQATIDLFVWAVQSWEGITNQAKGNEPIPCTDEYKRAVAASVPALADCAVACAMDEAKKQALGRDEEAKN